MRRKVKIRLTIAIILLFALGTKGIFVAKDKIDENKFYDLNESGLEFMENGYFNEALADFEEADALYKKSDQALINIAKINLLRLDYSQALIYIEQAIKFDPDNNTIDEYFLSSDILMYLERIDDAARSLKRANSISEEDVALEHLKSIDIDKIDRLKLMSYVDLLEEMTSYDETIAIIDKWIEKHPKNSSGYNIKGVAFYNAGYEYEAIEPLKKAIELEEHPVYYSNLLDAYYYSDRIFKCQEVANKIMDIYSDDFEAKHYLAQTYILLNEYEKSILLLEELLEVKTTQDNIGYSTHEDIIASLVEIYYYMGNEEKALEYINQYVTQNSYSDDTIKYFADAINEKHNTKDDVSYLRKLFKENYLYESNLEVVDGLSGDLSDEEVKDLLNALKKEDDPFTYVLYGDYYNYYANSQPDFEYRNLGDNIHYINFETFSQTVNYSFIQALDTIDDSENSTLVIDLRDNLGGRLNPASSMLDNLIGEATLFTEVSDTEYDVHYESNPMNIEFKEIYVLVNNHSASASEILALSLSVHLDNVTIVGEQTYGKGVGQNIFSDAENQRTYYIVNFYLNVGDENINGVGITPDIIVENDEIDSYITELLNLTDF